MSPKDFSEEEIQRISSVVSYVKNHLHQQFTVRQLARLAALGEQRFTEGFYKEYGQTVAVYIHDVRMKSARFLVTHTEKSLKEIAGLCGYREYKSFLKAFQKYFGVSAGGERKR